MVSLIRALVFGLVLTALVAALAGWMGVRYGLGRAERPAGLDALLHRELGLTGLQNRAIDSLESAYAARRAALTAEMRAANRDLAAAIAADHALSPRAQRAIDRFHVAMSELQTETIEHVLAMRAVLGPARAARFDREISKALSSPS